MSGPGAAAGTTAPGGRPQLPEPVVKADVVFKAYCAVCHGVDAKGDGPMAKQLKVMPANLTVLAKNNQGQFPAARVRKMIAGEEEPGASHGSRDMPIWGPIFRGIADQATADARLDTLVKYLESIQQK